ncbi:MAG: AAA family ATPase [Desulfobulbaceae bacterium]|jgi:ATP-dependent 26S proteasome regulatory subunit
MTTSELMIRDQFFIPERFRQVVSLHILKNNLKRVEVDVPLLLGIYGPTGEGKTVQCEHILKNMGVKRFLISGGQLDNPIPGQPARLVRSIYIKASDSIRSGECSLAVVLINDIDTGLGSLGKSAQYSVNQLTVFADLMHLVDYPKSVEGKSTLRIPIIITGNDFTKLYEPLVRAGRMTAFEWLPTAEERVEIVSSIFPELQKQECEKLIHELNQQIKKETTDRHTVMPIAFYSHLRSSLLDEDLWKEVEQAGLDRTVDAILRGNEPDLSLGINYQRVLDMGLALARSGRLVNHLT